MLGKKLSEIHLADLTFRRQFGIGQRRVAIRMVNQVHRTLQHTGEIVRAKFMNHLVENAESPGTISVKVKQLFDSFVVCEQRLGILNGNRRYRVAQKIRTIEIDDRKGACFISPNLIVSSLGQNHDAVRLRNVFFFTLKIRNLSAFAKRQPIRFSVCHLIVSAFFRIDGHGTVYLGYGYLLKIHRYHLFFNYITIDIFFQDFLIFCIKNINIVSTRTFTFSVFYDTMKKIFSGGKIR